VAVVDTAGQVITRSNTSISVDSVTSVTAAVTEGIEGNILDDDLLMCMSLCNRYAMLSYTNLTVTSLL
jgi:hypothetical protein